jgi:hypothetical protein
VQSQSWSTAYDKVRDLTSSLQLIASARHGQHHLTSLHHLIQASTAVAKMSLSEKVGALTGQGLLVANCTGSTSSAPSVGFPGFCLQGDASSFG